MHPFCWAGKRRVSLKATITEDLQNPIGMRECAKRVIPKGTSNLEQSSAWRSRCGHGLENNKVASGGKKNKKAIIVVGDRARATCWLVPYSSSDWLLWPVVLRSVILGPCCWFSDVYSCFPWPRFQRRMMELWSSDHGSCWWPEFKSAGSNSHGGCASVKCERGLSNSFRWWCQ
jgi:hypothetical protein